MKTFEDYKLQANMSYARLAKLAGLGTDAAFRAVRYPWRTRIETIMKIAEVLNIPRDEATELWKVAKKEFNIRRYS
jgi:hypothetical protein